MDFLELKEPGASVAMLVQKVSRAKSKFGQDYVFTGNVEPDRQASVSVPEKATERQLTNVLKVDSADELKGRFIVISRSDEPGDNGKLYWNIAFATEDTFVAPRAVPPASHRVQASESGGGEDSPAPVRPPARKVGDGTRAEDGFYDYGEELKRDPHGDGRPAAAAPPVKSESQQRPTAAEPVTERELTAAERKGRARMVHLRKVWRGLWKDEALAQLQVAGELAAEHPNLPRITITAESVNAGTAAQFIQFNKENLV